MDLPVIYNSYLGVHFRRNYKSKKTVTMFIYMYDPGLKTAFTGIEVAPLVLVEVIFSFS